ncbi:pyrroloquinoline quinone biosynthesis protein PqqD [Thioclava sp. SK-1]|uniref:pyrroloquinoline quinone biosynthesis peptide chaperone PqqD n=1 Tax=Thioclava sp. SK-1 TaxID=1889770 RepID=UPI000824612E|nr:pyrroloquinoline quinone biosynthesis peptide chaperone PqqD [Thioclava sp. SK-1]OCX58104.1 pyrroloquinoline quinone biosynthesis protein PqqD [Thioclava sp. SK-1]
MIAAGAVPKIPRGVRLHWDHIRDRWVLLVPEKTIALDQIGHAIISKIDNHADFATLVARLATKYDAPDSQIAPDVSGFIETLAARRILEVL